MGNYENIDVTFKETIYPFNYNPIHALWQALKMVGLQESWLDPVSFLAAAETAYDEGIGISMNLRDHQPTLTYIKSILTHVNGIIFYGVDGKLHVKLIRDDYIVSNLQVVDTNILLDEPTFERGSWMETNGEVKVQYSQITEPIEED